MSSSLFDADTKRSFNWKFPLIGFFVLALVFGGAGFVYYRSIPAPRPAADIRAEELRDVAVRMLGAPTFSGDEYAKQLLGEKAKMQWFDRKKNEVYLSHSDASQEDFDAFLARVLIDPAKVVLGRADGDRARIGDYSLLITDDTKYFLKTSGDNFRVDPDLTLKFPFKSLEYTLSLDELRDYMDNSRVYGGKLVAEATTTSDKPRMLFANHGIMVAKPGEPSLKRIVDELLKEESIGDNREKRVQRLLDFVSNEIEYSYTEALSGRETLKRADETLMTRNGDCSNKTILLASLLEQIGEDYILIYCPRHISVAVPAGNFPSENKLEYEHEGKKYVIAESTMPGFQIGKTKVQQSEILNNVQYVQSPRQIDLIFDAKSYNYVKFY